MPVLHDETQTKRVEPDSLHVSFQVTDFAGHVGPKRNVMDQFLRNHIRMQDKLEKMSNNQKNQRDPESKKSRKRAAKALAKNQQNGKGGDAGHEEKSDTVIMRDHHSDRSSDQRRNNIFDRRRDRHADRRIWVGVYDSKLIPDLGDTPSWLVLSVRTKWYTLTHCCSV